MSVTQLTSVKQEFQPSYLISDSTARRSSTASIFPCPDHTSKQKEHLSIARIRGKNLCHPKSATIIKWPLEESFYPKISCFPPIKIFAARNSLVIWTLKNKIKDSSKIPIIHEFIHVYPLTPLLPCVWHYIEYQGYNDVQDRDNPHWFMDLRIHRTSKNERNNYTTNFLGKYAEPTPNTGLLNLLSETHLPKYSP